MQIVNNVTTVDIDTEDGPVTGVQVAWEVIDPQYPYMDIYTYTQDEWAEETPASLEARQTAQYNAWRAYMENPNG